MSFDGVRAFSANAARGLAAARRWLRRVMPQVAAASALLFVARALLRGTTLYRSTPLGTLLGLFTFLLVTLTLVYYGYGALRWLKRRLLWRVRRRLIITYLFVGLTPIVLLAGLGFMFGYGMALNMMAGSIMLEVNSTERQTLAAGQALADALAALPPETDARALQAWLDERVALLQATLPGARAAVWRGGAGNKNAPAGAPRLDAPAQLTSEPADERARGVGAESRPLGAALPEWLRGEQEWSGFVFLPPADEEERYGAPSLRALVRRGANGRHLALLLSVPVSRALVERLRANTGVYVRPTFQRQPLVANAGRAPERRRGATDGGAAQSPAPDRGELERAVNTQEGQTDQLGEPLEGGLAWVVMPATDWSSGERRSHIAFRFPSTLAAARKQALERGHLGQEVRLDLVLYVFIGIFLALETIALLAGGWITRAVTGTVHRLHRATQFIKRGDFSHRVRVRSHDQLGELAEAFNDMSANIEALLKERVLRERLEREVEIAAEVQAQLFPRVVPRLGAAEIVGECRAARGVAGDYYDYVELAPGLVVFALGDVSGKGISASLVMSNLQAALRAQTAILAERLKLAGRAAAVAVGGGADQQGALDLPCGVTGEDAHCAVENVVASVNQQLCHSTDSNRFATFFLALYDDHERLLRYTNAGHNAPVLVRADDTVERLDAGGTVVGAFEFVRYEEAATNLRSGDLLVLFSDGISEAQNPLGEEYGEQRLIEFVTAHRHLSAGELRQAIFTEVDRWSGGQERGDDQTVVIVKVS